MPGCPHPCTNILRREEKLKVTVTSRHGGEDRPGISLHDLHTSPSHVESRTCRCLLIFRNTAAETITRGSAKTVTQTRTEFDFLVGEENVPRHASFEFIIVCWRTCGQRAIHPCEACEAVKPHVYRKEPMQPMAANE
jgi:hypothetical protein